MGNLYTDPQEPKRWVILEIENGERILAKHDEETKTAAKVYSFDRVLTASFSKHFVTAGRDAAIKISQLFPSVVRMGAADHKALSAYVKSKIKTAEKFDEDFITCISTHIPSTIANAIVSDVKTAVKNSTNVYKYIDEKIIASGIGANTVLACVKQALRQGQLDDRDINYTVLAKVIQEQVDPQSTDYKEGFRKGLTFQKISNHREHSVNFLRGFYDGKEDAYLKTGN